MAELAIWKLLAQFQQRMKPVLAAAPKADTELDPRRTLLPADYFSLIFFALLNPAIKTARALCGASHFEKMKTEVCREPVSLASFSEMQSVVDPELLAGLLRSISKEAMPIFGDARLREKVEVYKGGESRGVQRDRSIVEGLRTKGRPYKGTGQ